MTDMPERIWVEQPEIFDAMGFWQEHQSADLVEYVRADLPPKVKPLVWTLEPRNGWKHGVCYAPPYHIIRRDDGWHYANGAGGVFSELDAAKAAAQADHESHILAALVQP